MLPATPGGGDVIVIPGPTYWRPRRCHGPIEPPLVASESQAVARVQTIQAVPCTAQTRWW
jgi:hypothetical protein